MTRERLSREEIMTMDPAELDLVGAEDDDDNDSESQDDGTNGEQDEQDDKSGKSNEDDEETKVDPKDSRIAALEEEKDRHYDRRKTAEKRVTELEAEIAALKAGGTDDEDLKKQVSETTTRINSLESQNADLLLENAFLKDNSHSWRDPAAALKLADLSQVEIDSDGKVQGLKAALDKLAAKSPYLLNSSDDDETPRKSGRKPKRNDQTDEKSRQAREASYRAKYPGLRR